MILNTIFTTTLYAFDNKITHPRLTEISMESAKKSLTLYFNESLSLPNGFNTSINRRSATEWIVLGSINEDIPDCRASNHFHNPRNNLPWTESGLTDQNSFINSICKSTQYPPEAITSNVHWATRYSNPAPYGSKLDLTGNGSDWDGARRDFYTYLTGRSYNSSQPAVTTENVRNMHLAWALEDLGKVIHLLQDMGVPSHVRNDFLAHLEWKGITSSNLLHATQWTYERFEDWVKNNNGLIASASSINLAEKTITNFWDTNNYDGANPDISLNADLIGLAEYTNINFVSENTVFTENYLTDADSSNDLY